MKRILSFIISVLMMFCASSYCYTSEISSTERNTEIILQIDNPVMSVNGASQEIDKGMGTAPVIVNDRTLVPIRAIIEAIGGTASWEAETRTANLNYGKDKIDLVIDSTTAYLNGEAIVIDTAPAIINDRTMLPIRFIAESFQFDVKWDDDTQTITITKEATEKPDAVSSATTVKDSLSPSSDATSVPSADTKMLVVYFSRAGENYSVGTVDKGNTSYIADYIAEKTGADVFEIIPKNPYPEGYEDTKTRATNERDSNARPEYVGEVENFEQYDVVFIGHPIWWGDMPMIMYTFLENHDFNGKTVCQFNTHEGSGNSGTSATIKQLLPNAAVTDYLAVRGSTAQKNGTELKTAVDNWLEALGLSASILNNSWDKIEITK